MVMEMSKTYQYRKVMKPLLERKRRARINKCLDDLKDLMVECLQQEGEHVTRLEKADILELTVEHMRKLKQRGGLSLQATPQSASAHVESFRSGYVHAADQITQVLLQQRQTDEIGGKIMKFLSTRLIEMQHQLLRTSAAAVAVGAAMETSPTASSSSAVQVPSANINFLAASPTSSLVEPSLEFHNMMNYKQFASADKNADLIDVTTVEDQSSLDTASVISVESSGSSESMWRPW